TLRVEDGYVLADGETILEVGQYTDAVGERLLGAFGNELHVMGDPLTDDAIPCINGVLLPAFVKAHGHDHEQPLIGIAKDEPLTSWLDHAVNPFSRFLRIQREGLSELLGCSPQLAVYRMARLADIHYGITASMVHHCNFSKYHLEEIAQANETAGTTMIVAVGGQDRHYMEEVLDKPGEAVERLERAVSMNGLERTSFCPGPDQLFSNSREQLIPLKRWAREHDTLFHVHSAEEPNTTRWFTAEIEPGMTPVEFANSIGILDESTVLAHQVNCGPKDLEILARTGTRIVHNPLANTILGSGMPPVMEMIAANIPVAISTDGSGSSDNQNILAAARLAAQYQKAFHQDATLLPSQQLMEMVTVIPSEILRLNQGELAPGRQADWVVLDLDRPNLTPTRLDNLTENLVWAADGSEVSTVVARGRILKKDGRVFPFKDGTTPEQVMKNVQVLSERFILHLDRTDELRGTGAHR
ncbi:MAG: amidohydrolase family protein, partial [Thermoanaerobaculales bacterium]|nr:amidohydrolase family protein [Thermoanaerobaculales bacterium]